MRYFERAVNILLFITAILALIALCFGVKEGWGAEFQLPAELAFLNQAEVVAVQSCVKKDTGEKAICIIFATNEAMYMLAVDPETKQVREAFRKEGEKAIRIYQLLRPI